MQTAMQHFLEQIQAASANELMVYARVGSAEVQLADRTQLPFVQHMTHILVSGAEIEVTFKTHFMNEAADWLLSQKVGKGMSLDHAIDFMKEYSNIIAGKTKTMLEAAGFEVSQSLPFAVRGYNEIFYGSGDKKIVHHTWMIKAGDAALHCSVSIVSRDVGALEKLRQTSYQPKDSGDVGEAELF
jgi:CheY-specific phosphatase CheX